MHVNVKDRVPDAPDEALAHLSGTGALTRQVFAAHFMRPYAHVLEIGGHLRPVTPYLTHHPVSVTSVDPKTPAYLADSLNGTPCRVRHIPSKFQEIDYDHAPGTYGLVLLGYSLKPFGTKDPIGDRLFSLVDNAGTIVVEFAPELERAVRQVPWLIDRPNVTIRTMIDLTLHDPEITRTPYAARRLYVLDTQHTAN